MSELDSTDLVLGAVRKLVADGEYLDTIPGKPGVALEGGGWFQSTPKGPMRRMYTRGSREHATAKQAGGVDRLPELSPATESAVAEAEELIGRRLPILLKRLYLEVGNGGFGPGYGLLGLRGGHTDQRRTAIDMYHVAHDGTTAWWPFLRPALLPICHWGCGIYSHVDCSNPDGEMWAWDPNPGPADERALFAQGLSFREWMARWIRRQLYQPALIWDDRAETWRGATDEEIQAEMLAAGLEF